MNKENAMREYWAKMSPEQRSAEMKRRMKMGERKRRKAAAAASTESPFPPELVAQQGVISSHRSLRNLISELNSITEELKALFEF